jgi:hypothetical protein
MSDLTRRAERRQKRLDQRRQEAMPLFATVPAVLESVAPLPSVDALQREQLGREQQVRAMHLRRTKMSLDVWLRWRGVCERYIGMEQVRHCESYCRRLYPSYRWEPGYRADYWHRLARDLGLDPSWPEPTWWAWPGKR